MTATFETGLFGTTTTGTFVKCLAFTLPPAASNTSHTISISSPTGVTVSIVPPSGMSWNQNTQTLTIPSTFTASSSRVELDLSNGTNAFISVFLSGSAQNGVASSLEVDEVGRMSVTSTGQDVTFKGFTPLIQSIPEFGHVTITDAVFLLPNVTGLQDFTFRTLLGTLATDNSSTATLSESDTIATIHLAPEATVTLTATLSTGGGTVTCTFTVQTLDSSTTVSSGSEIDIDASSNDVLRVDNLDSGALLRGNSIHYERGGPVTEDPQIFDLAFSFATGNFNFVSPFATLSNTSDFSLDTTTASFVRITHEDTGLASTSLTLFTDAGIWDPTIINDPDPGPLE